MLCVILLKVSRYKFKKRTRSVVTRGTDDGYLEDVGLPASAPIYKIHGFIA